MARIDLVLVDFDDTLVDTAPRFLGARRALFERLEALGFDGARCREVHHGDVDPVMRKTYGLGPARLEHAFRETYGRLCAETGLPLDATVADALAEIGRAVAGTPPVLDGAIDALRRLADEYPTALYTQSGDPAYQLRCVREAGVFDILPADRIHVCPRKTPDAFREALDRFGIEDPARAWMVGNSIRSDLNPALACGARAILVDVHEPWEFDMVDPLSDDFVRAGSFAEAVTYLLGGNADGERATGCA